MDSATRTPRRAALTAVALLVLGNFRIAGATAPATREEKLTLPGFGAVAVYRPQSLDRARGVVLFVSGDGGWNQGVVDMARRIADRAIVAGLSMPAWKKRAEGSPSRCWYPAGELEVAAQSLEKQLRLPRYVAPILIGYSSGATAVYGALAQAPPTTFAGAVSLGFCPDLEVARPLCGRGDWRPIYDAKKRITLLGPDHDLSERDDGSARWIALQGTIDQVCDPASTQRFVAATGGAKLISLDRVGHGFSVPRRWGESFDAAVRGLLPSSGVLDNDRSDPPAYSDVEARLAAIGLPLEVSWPDNAREAVIFVSGDGGWADLDRAVAEELSRRGIAVVGWNALRYFWTAKTPEQFSADLSRVVVALPSDVRVFAGGYSFGAESVPWAVAGGLKRGDPEIARIAGLVLLEPSRYATFEVSPLDWLRSSSEATSHSVKDGIANSGNVPVLCVDGAEEPDSGCHDLPAARVAHAEIPGGHHFGGEFTKVADAVASFIASTH